MGLKLVETGNETVGSLWAAAHAPGDLEAVMADPLIRRAERWEGLDRVDILRAMTDRQLSLAATRLLQFERAASRSRRRDESYLATCRRDLDELVGEMLRRDTWLELRRSASA